MKLKLLILIMFNIMLYSCIAQNFDSKKPLSLLLKGLINIKNKPVPNVEIKVFLKDKEIDKMTSDSLGKFKILFEYDNVYIIEISMNDYVTQKILVNTTLVKKTRNDICWSLKLNIDLFKMTKNIDKNILSKPIIEIKHYPDIDDYKVDYSKRQLIDKQLIDKQLKK